MRIDVNEEVKYGSDIINEESEEEQVIGKLHIKS